MRWLSFATGRAFFDVWSIVHLSFWIFIGSCLWSFKLNFYVTLYSCLVVAFAWEIFERYAEKAWPNRWLNPESWWNAWISDPLMCVAGVCLIWWLLDHRP